MKNLFDRTNINGIELKNRIIRSATWEALALENGELSKDLIDVYRKLAEGEIGLIITGFLSVRKEGLPFKNAMMLEDDNLIEDYKTLTSIVHENGSKIIAQLAYGSTQTSLDIKDYTFWGPSSVSELQTKHIAKEMTKEDIKSLISSFGDAGERAKKAGFDGVQIHAAHGYLLSQFLNPYLNQRQDEYGGSIENRSRIIVEIYDELRKRLGAEYPILIKINSQDFIEKSITPMECLYVCKILDDRRIDAIEVSAGMAASGELGAKRKGVLKPEQEAYFKDNAALIAENVKAPVILVGGVRSLDVINTLLNETKIQYVSLARPFLREPDLVKRWANGDTAKAKCISCNQCYSPEGSSCIFMRKNSYQ